MYTLTIREAFMNLLITKLIDENIMLEKLDTNNNKDPERTA